MRKGLAVLALVGAWIAGVALYRRAAPRRRDRVDLYFDDGSMLSLADDTPETAEIVALAHEVLGTA